MNDSDAAGQWQSSEFLVLKKLLASWNLDCLLEHFVDEGISVEVLQMLRPHHIPGLLRNHKLGLQIRFEHHLERWRRRIDKPLVDPSHALTSAHLHRCPCSQNVDMKPWLLQPSTPTPTPPAVTRNVSTQFPFRDLQQQQQQQPRPSLTSLSQGHSAASETRPPPRLTPAPISSTATSAPTSAASTANASASASANTRTTTTTTSPPDATTATPITTSTPATPTLGPGRPIKHSIFSSDDYRPPNVNLNLILQASQPKGPQLIDYYREHQTLTSAHRLLLINLIATFFDDNDYHLSLQTSYNLEREILELFPSERLEFYRTEKRGKIYVKFCNMKRYKAVREKPLTKRLRRDDTRGGGGAGDASGLELKPSAHVDVMPNMEDDDFTMAFDSWEQQPPMEVYIKTENLNEDGYA